MPSVFEVLDHIHHGLRVLRQLQLLRPVLGDLKHLEIVENEEDDQN